MTVLGNREITFEAPDDFSDHTVFTFQSPRQGGSNVPPSVTLMKVEIPAQKSLAAFVADQVASLATGLKGFEILDQRELDVADTRGIQVLFTWRHLEGPIVQRITIFKDGDTGWTFTGTALRKDLERAAPMFDRVLKTVRFPRGPRPKP